MSCCGIPCHCRQHYSVNKPFNYIHSDHVPVTDSNTVRELTWTYPVIGYPEQVSEVDQPAVVTCRARDRVDERLEVTLSGVAPSSAGPKRGITARARTPADEAPNIPDGVVVGESKYSKTCNLRPLKVTLKILAVNGR